MSVNSSSSLLLPFVITHWNYIAQSSTHINKQQHIVERDCSKQRNNSANTPLIRYRWRNIKYKKSSLHSSKKKHSKGQVLIKCWCILHETFHIDNIMVMGIRWS